MKSFSVWLRYFRRRIHSGFIHPVKTTNREATYFARGSMFGLFVGLTPTVGFQIPLLALIWGVLRKVYPRWDFSLLIASGWTLITNVATVPVFYYLFLQTGRVMLGRWENVRSYELFDQSTTTMLGKDAGFFESFYVISQHLFNNYGLPLFLGSLPWAILAAWAGYVWTTKLVTRLRNSSKPLI